MQKIKLYPNTFQKEKLRELFGVNRYLYNKIVFESKDDMFDLTRKQFEEKYRKLVVKSKMQEEEYIMSKPEHSFDSAYRDVLKAIKTTKALSAALKKKTGSGFKYETLKFKTKKQISNSIEISSRDIKSKNKNITFWPTYFGKDNKFIKIKEELPFINYSCRLQKTINNEYFLCIPQHNIFKKANQDSICSIDPGVRSMLTCYDPSGIAFELGTNIEKMVIKQKHIDRLKSIIQQFKGKKNKKYKLKQERRFIEKKIKNCMSDCHHKITKFLSENYNQILLPAFETQQMMQKKKRKISKSTTRNMSTWSHYKFKMMLAYKMQRVGGKLIICTEEYTSKTCSNCGKINHKLKGEKTFTCPTCKVCLDRDINGARNIYIKNHGLLSQVTRDGEQPSSRAQAA